METLQDKPSTNIENSFDSQYIKIPFEGAEFRVPHYIAGETYISSQEDTEDKITFKSHSNDNPAETLEIIYNANGILECVQKITKAGDKITNRETIGFFPNGEIAFSISANEISSADFINTNSEDLYKQYRIYREI
ncbi:hypothetical protein M1145_00265 [Patescibacteria group bacterium]|nr:hypothetical protein [Patescibacteria group bacterium]